MKSGNVLNPIRQAFKEKEKEALHIIYDQIVEGERTEVQNQIANYLYSVIARTGGKVTDTEYYKAAICLKQFKVNSYKDLYAKLKGMDINNPTHTIRNMGRFLWYNVGFTLPSPYHKGKQTTRGEIRKPPFVVKGTKAEPSSTLADDLKAMKGEIQILKDQIVLQSDLSLQREGELMREINDLHREINTLLNDVDVLKPHKHMVLRDSPITTEPIEIKPLFK